MLGLSFRQSIRDVVNLAASLVGETFALASSKWINETSTFSAWGTAVGVFPAFDEFEFKIRSWKPDEQINNVRIRIRENDNTGTILFDTTIADPVSQTDANDILRVSMNTLVDTDQVIWFEYFTDGRSGIFGDDPDVSANPWALTWYATHKNINGVLSNSIGSSKRLCWIKFYKS